MFTPIFAKFFKRKPAASPCSLLVFAIFVENTLETGKKVKEKRIEKCLIKKASLRRCTRKDTTPVLFALRRVVLLRSYIRLSPSVIRFASFIGE